MIMNQQFFAPIILVVLTLSHIVYTNNDFGDQWESQQDYFGDKSDELVAYVYHLLSDSPSGMTVEQFGEFVNCSRGLSNCKLKGRNITEPLHLIKNCSLQSDLFPFHCNIFNECLTIEDFLKMVIPSYDQNSKSLTEAQVKSVIPSILYQSHSKICLHGQENESVVSKRPSSVEVWMYAVLFVTLISACSLVGVSVLPIMAREFYQKLLTLLIGLAVGSLAGSAVFHLIPQAYGIVDTAENHDYLFMSLAILLGIWSFFIIERTLKTIFMNGNCCMKKSRGSISSQGMMKPSSSGVDFKNSSDSPSCDGDMSAENGTSNELKLVEGSAPSDSAKFIYASQEQVIKASFGHGLSPEKSPDVHDIQFQQGKDSVIGTVAWMIIFGDGFHNFIDGISIGAAFQRSVFTGISVSVAVMCEELPHELGDFAVLLNAGMTMKQALFYNFLSATTCYLGMIIGILLGEFTENSTYIFAIAGGMFLYISLVDMVPEMNEIATKSSAKGTKHFVITLLYQNLGLFLGVFSLFFLAYYQDQFAFA